MLFALAISPPPGETKREGRGGGGDHGWEGGEDQNKGRKGEIERKGVRGLEGAGEEGRGPGGSWRGGRRGVFGSHIMMTLSHLASRTLPPADI